MSRDCLCADCRSIRDDELQAQQAAARRARQHAQLRLPMSPLPHLAGFPAALPSAELQQELF